MSDHLHSPEDPLVRYTCPHGNEHTIPSPKIRVLKSGDGDFIVACACGSEPLAENHESPHPETNHFVNIGANAPSPEGWLYLDSIADAWYDVDPHVPPEDYTGTRAQRRQQVRERAKQLADETPNSISISERKQAAREIDCPDCGAARNQKCKRPSGHRVRDVHADRVERAVAKGILDSEQADSHEPSSSQVALSQFSSQSTQ